ncbi:MAG: hypothetical protein Q4B31_04545 [Clostridia bacterium]|nr:hypothetical protein [Clostridia bacterium]
MGNLTRPKDMTNLESILEKNTDIKYSERWHPSFVSEFERVLSRGSFVGMNKELRKNIAYSLQYLEFLQMEYDEIHWHDVVLTQMMKTYIITAMSIIEGVFHHIVISKGYQKKTDWKEIDSPRHTNVFSNEGINKKYIITTQMKLSKPENMHMDFEFLINKVQEKKLISLPGKSYPKLKAMKSLRNKVHLHVTRYDNDTDYLGISYNDYFLARYFLYAILTDKSFKPKKNSAIEFIKLSDKQLERILNTTENNDDNNI